MTTTVNGIAELELLVGQHLGWSHELEVTQDRIDTFADATGDHQWIHVDPERAKDGPFGAPIAHGYLTLSLAPALLPTILRVQGVRMAVNYGLGKVRFPSPVTVGSKVRLGAELMSVKPLPDDGAEITMMLTSEVVGAPKPACVAEIIFRYYE